MTAASLISAAMILSCATAARAQNALGNGDALDRNTAVGSGGRNSGAPANPFAGRNAVVTGEVIGGREFRGRVGYTAPADFRGALGSNETYRFRADSAWSSPASMSLGSTTYEQLRFGQGLGVLELSRSGTGATIGSVMQAPGPVNYSDLAESHLKYDNEVLTASSSSRLLSSMQSTTIGTSVTAQGEAVAITASSARGLTLDQYNERWQNLGLTTYDQVRMREEIAGVPGSAKPEDKTKSPSAAATEVTNRVGDKFETRFEALQANTAATGEARVDASMQADYARLLQHMADRFAHTGDRSITVDPAILRTLTEQFKALQGQLSGQSPTNSGPRQSSDPTGAQPLPTPAPSAQAPTPSPTPGRPESNNPSDPRNTERPRPAQPPAPTDNSNAKPPEDGTKPIDLSQLGPALRHGEKIERLSSEEQGRFNELMTTAEEQLKKGEFMQAEQRFQRALRFSPGNPLASAGAANAQIGAGLYLPAGYTLRALFTQHPEMIDATYGEGLLPPKDRLDAAIAAVKARLDLPPDRSANALLLAYLGRQIGDRTLMEEGIKAMAAESADDPLPPLLRTVWLEGGEAPKAEPEK